MKLKKHIFTILLVVLLFLLIGSVSATDINTNDTQTVSASGNDEVLSVENDVDILGDGEYNYTYLRQQINSGGDITLIKGNYTYADGDGDTIEITNSGVIDGNGAVIDMAGSGHRAFYVTASRVTIKNLTIKNANYNGDGGAIYFSQSGTVENCNFTDNQATGDGGAIYFAYSDTPSTVTNCNFTANQATGNGGAILIVWGTVTNCNFTGNTATRGGAVYFHNGTVSNCNFTANQANNWGGAILMNSGSVTNCNFTNNQATGDGGAIYFEYSDIPSTVTNCNFTGNKATGTNSWGGAVYFDSDCDVRNCNFTDNQATGDGGAIGMGSGSVTNCNFTNNSAVYGGAIRMTSGSVENCNFINNTATNGNGGAIMMYSGSITNCNFTGNNATTGSAIYFYWASTKTIFNSIFLNNRANSEVLEVIKNENNITITFTGNDNLLNAIYSNGEVSFTNVTYWGANGIANTGSSSITPSRSNKEAGQNITVSIVINNEIVSNEVYVTDANGRIVLNRNVGDNYFIGVCHDTDSYYTEKINTTSNNTKFNVNVTSQTTNNKTVNITAKSNIPNEVIKGKLLFILPNSTEINATYASNGTWWALHTFDDAGDYNINATYIGLDDVIINNATIRIMNVIPINTSDISISFGDIANVIVYVPETINGQNITITVNKTSKNATVKNGEAKANFTNLPTGKHLITADYLGDDYNCANSTNATLTVSKRPTEISLKNKTIDLFVKSSIETGATLIPADAGNLTYTVSNPSIAIVENGKIKSIKQGKTNITVSFAGNENYTAAENKTITVTVNLNDASITVNNETLNLKIGQNFTIIANTTPEGINVTYVQDDSGVYIVDKNGVVTALKNGTGSVLVKIGGDGVYAENSTIVNVTVTKVPTEIKVTNTTLDLKVDGEIETGATLIPADAGNLTYTISNPSIVKIEDGKIIALKEGNTTITVSFTGNKKYLPAENKTINVTVRLNDASVKVNNNTLNLLVEDTLNLNATTEPKDLTVNYTSTNPSVVTVDNKGNVMAVSEGNATITVTVGGDGKYAENTTTVTVTVSKVPTEISINPDSLDLFVGDETVIAANLTPSDAGNVTFTSSDDSVVTVDNQGNVIAQGKGQAIITVSFAGDNKYAAAENKTIKVTVKKINAPMNVSAEDITVGENATIIVTLPDDAAGNVTATINGKTHNGQVNKGKADIIIPDLTSGNYTVPVIYSGDDKYNGAKGDANVTVNKADAAISIDAPPITEGDNATVSVTLPGDATGKVTVGNEIVTVKDGTASVVLTGLKAGITTVPVTYSGDEKYNLIETSADVIVNEKPTPANENLTIKATAEEITEGENATVIVTGLENATGNVSTNINGKTYTSSIEDGKASITVPGLSENVTAVVNYPGDDKYNPAMTTVNITVNRNTVTINAQNLTKNYKDPQKFTVNVTDAKGQAAPNKTVEITINGVTYKRTTDENGTASLNINLGAGEYPVSITVDDVTVNSTVTVKSTIDASDVVKMFRNDTQYYATFTDANGTPLANTQVSFNINGVIYNRTTDANGTAKMNINMGAGDYIITATNPVTGEMKSNNIKVISLIESDDLTKYYKNASQFVVRIHSADGGYVGAGEEVTFNINGVFYTRTTNATGHAKLNINLPQGNYTITTYHKDCSQGNEITVLPLLSADDLVMKYRDGSQFKAKLVDGQGKAYPGQTVQFNINGVLYNRVTGSDGIAKLNINLMSGQYIITSSYNGANIANKITIRG